MKPKRPGLRSPDWLVDERIAEAVAVISSRPNIHRCQLHKLLCPRWKDKKGKQVAWSTVDSIVSRARDLLLQRLNRSKEDFRCDVLSAYEKELASDKPGVRLTALVGIRELLGLDAPRRQEVTGADGVPLAVSTSTVVVYLPEKDKIIDPYESRNLIANGQGNGHGNGDSNGD